MTNFQLRSRLFEIVIKGQAKENASTHELARDAQALIVEIIGHAEAIRLIEAMKSNP